MRIQRISVAKLGGLPCISRPTRNTLPAIHTVAKTAAMPIAIDAAICQAGGGTLDDRRRIITKGLTGGIRLATVASVPLGSRLIGCHSIIGSTMVSITG